MLDQVGLLAKLENTAADLTLAEQKRLEVARALATRPQACCCSTSPWGAQPARGGGGVRRSSCGSAAAGVTVVLVEHVMRAIMRISDRVVVIHHGETIADGRRTAWFGPERDRRRISARGWPSVLRVETLEVTYGKIQALWGITFDVREGRDRRRRRRERRREDDDAQDAVRPPSPQGRDASSWRPAAGPPLSPAEIVELGRGCTCRRGGSSFPR